VSGGEAIAFRALAKADLAMLHRWLNRPHLRPFFQRSPINLDEVLAKYGPRVRREVPTLSHLAFLNGRPFGYLQCYRIADWPDYAREINVGNAIGVDYFIAVPKLIGRGLGHAMIAAYLRDVAFPAFPHAARCVVCYDEANVASGRALEGAGFRHVRDLMEGGLPSRMMALERP
jgi:aminoglycoside 6'-N-acetyltransferase